MKTDHSVTQLREIELKVQREINEKRQELLAKEESLRSVIKRGGTRMMYLIVSHQEPGESTCGPRFPGRIPRLDRDMLWGLSQHLIARGLILRVCIPILIASDAYTLVLVEKKRSRPEF